MGRQTTMWDVRIASLSAISGLLAAAVACLGIFVLDRLLVTYPARALGAGLLLASASAFPCACVAFLWYAHSEFLAGWAFGGLAGVVSGAFSGIGFLLSYDKLSPVGLEFFSHGFVGAMIGGVIGAMIGGMLGPVMARFANRTESRHGQNG